MDSNSANATEYIQGFTRPRHQELQELMRECRPNAGYGTQGDLLDHAVFLVDYVDNQMLNMAIPGDYATPDSAVQVLRSFVRAAKARETALAKVARDQTAKHGTVSWNLSQLLINMREYRKAAEHAIALFRDAEQVPQVGRSEEAPLAKEPQKPSPPNWANITSAFAGVIALAGAAIFWAATLQMQVRDLEKRLESIRSPRQPARFG